MTKKLIPILTAFFFSFTTIINAQTINIPDDFPTIQQGIDNAGEGDTVLVAPGIYTENLFFNGINIVLASQYLTTGQESYIVQTIIDGQKKNAVITLENGETNATKIIGFTLKNGSNDENEDMPVYGGGIVCIDASPTILKNKITKCVNNYFGYNDFGGIYCLNSNAVIEQNVIDSLEGYFVQKYGGIVAHQSSLTITNNTISNTIGGYCFNCAGITADSSELNISGNLIYNGSYDAPPYSSSVKIFNSISTLTNNTFNGEVALNHENTITLLNNIIDSPTEDMAIIEMSESNASIYATYNNLKGAWFGVGNDNADPLFVDAENGNYHLTGNSPCIDSGDPGLFDPDNTRSDKGAFYFDQGPTSVFERLQTELATIHPNPATDFVQIDFQHIVQADLNIYSATGQLIKSQSIRNNKTMINLESNLSGVYYFVLKSGKKIQTQKVVIMK